MAKGVKGFTKGNEGKPKGAVNKTVQEARVLFVQTLEGQVPNIEEAFEKVREKDPAMYLNLLSKYAQYFVPKMVDITTGGEKMNFVPISKFAENDNQEPQV
jgi:hypothetical protein